MFMKRDARPSPRRIFISDLHLDRVEDTRFVRFAECLAAEAHWADEIFVLGDLFEAWPGDDDDSELATRICSVLKQASTTAHICFMPGNRDFLCGSEFSARSGANLIEDPFLTTDNFILAHGDALCTDDVAYQGMRKIVRSSAWQADMLAKPLAERQAIAAKLRREITEAKANKPQAIMDASPDAAARLFEALGANVMVHGHTHRPAIHRCAATTRYVLGDWARCGWLLRQTGPRFELECFNLAQPYGQRGDAPDQ